VAFRDVENEGSRSPQFVKGTMGRRATWRADTRLAPQLLTYRTKSRRHLFLFARLSLCCAWLWCPCARAFDWPSRPEIRLTSYPLRLRVRCHLPWSVSLEVIWLLPSLEIVRGSLSNDSELVQSDRGSRQKHASQWQQDRVCDKPKKVTAFADDGRNPWSRRVFVLVESHLTMTLGCRDHLNCG